MGEREVVAICDDELLGKEFSANGLNLKVSRDFYCGDKENEEFIKKILLKADNISLVGEKCIKLAVELNVVDKKNIIKIQGVPYTFVFRF